jgi:hypothetical protein
MVLRAACPTRRSSRRSCLRFAAARPRLSLGVEAVEKLPRK